MIDRQVFALVPGNMTAAFQRLNGAPMYDILDTFDALLKEKNFYPNVGQYRSQLDSAGIFVQRMEVAMSAVMSKNAWTTSYDQFALRNSAILAQLPPDQRANIEKYFTGASNAPGLTKSNLVTQYLSWANNALFQTRSVLLTRGAPNRLSDWPKGAPIMALPGYDRSDSSKSEEVARVAIENKGGNCNEFSAVAFQQLKKMGARPLHWFKLAEGDHAFVLIGEGPANYIESDDVKKWGDSVVVCDAWDQACYVASQIPDKLPGQGAAFKASRYEWVP